MEKTSVYKMTDEQVAEYNQLKQLKQKQIERAKKYRLTPKGQESLKKYLTTKKQKIQKWESFYKKYYGITIKTPQLLN